MSSFRSLYVNRAKYPHRTPVPPTEAVQPSLFDQAVPAPVTRTPRTPKPQPSPKPPVSAEPLPKRIYASNGLIFGLHDGGQEYIHVEIKWQYLKPAAVQRVEREEQ